MRASYRQGATAAIHNYGVKLADDEEQEDPYRASRWVAESEHWLPGMVNLFRMLPGKAEAAAGMAGVKQQQARGQKVDPAYISHLNRVLDAEPQQQWNIGRPYNAVRQFLHNNLGEGERTFEGDVFLPRGILPGIAGAIEAPEGESRILHGLGAGAGAGGLGTAGAFGGKLLGGLTGKLLGKGVEAAGTHLFGGDPASMSNAAQEIHKLFTAVGRGAGGAMGAGKGQELGHRAATALYKKKPEQEQQ